MESRGTGGESIGVRLRQRIGDCPKEHDFGHRGFFGFEITLKDRPPFDRASHVSVNPASVFLS